MSATVDVPDFWVFFNAAGKAIGSTLGTDRAGEPLNITAEDAWRSFTDTKRERERLEAAGVRVIAVAQTDWEDYWRGLRVPPELAAPAPVKRQLLVPGHTLAFEGAPHTDEGHRDGRWGAAGSGRAKCSCGDLSDVLSTTRARKQWHRDHKTDVMRVAEDKP